MASACKFENFNECSQVVEKEWKYTQKMCTHEKARHFLLMPYFIDNLALKDLYDKIDYSSLSSPLVERLQNLRSEFSHPTAGSGYDENVWSSRLKMVLVNILKPKYRVEYTASGNFSFPSLQYQRTNLGPEHIDVYSFRAVPDICIQKSIYVSAAEPVSAAQPTKGDEHDDSLEDSIFENTRQVGIRAVVPPKFKQLFASLHCFLVKQDGGYVVTATAQVWT